MRDAENRLIEVKDCGGTIATCVYDYQSRRISKTIGSAITAFVYDGWKLIADFKLLDVSVKEMGYDVCYLSVNVHLEK